jgi:hypothetical protein
MDGVALKFVNNNPEDRWVSWCSVRITPAVFLVLALTQFALDLNVRAFL